MIHFKKIDSWLVQKGDNLLELLPKVINRLYMDFETTSKDAKIASINPWKNCWPIGVAITWDDHPHAYYVTDDLARILPELLSRTKTWVNHNIKYDAHVLNNHICTLPPANELVLFDTITMAKLLDSERQFKGGYPLDVLARDWLGEEINPFEDRMQPYLIGSKNKDYGKIPTDILGEYACVDVLTNRKLDIYIQKRLPKSSYKIKDIEKATTRSLFEMECRGFFVDKNALLKKVFQVQDKLLLIIDDLREKFGFYIEPHVPKDCKKLLVDTLQLPILHWTKKGNPAFDKKTLRKYLGLASAQPHRKLIESLLLYRKLASFKSGFILPIIKYQQNWVTHSFYTQLVRTGRMSCKRPNVQAMSKLAKALIIPRKGYGFIVCDYSQIEFRLIVHFAKETDAIYAYSYNPEQDFHQLVADLADINRDDAKTLNFAVAYGQGERSTIETLSMQESVQKIAADAGITLPEHIANLRSAYFQKFPRIQPTARQAQYQCKLMGYSENAYGRRRHLVDEPRKAFNSIVQGTAADIMKESTNKLVAFCIPLGIYPIAIVHDEIVLECPIEMLLDKPLHHGIAHAMELPSVNFDVPIKIQLGTSSESWLHAKEDMKFVDTTDLVAGLLPKPSGKILGK